MEKSEQDPSKQKINHGLLALGAGLLAMGIGLLDNSHITWIPIFVIASSIIILFIYLVNIFNNSDFLS